MYFSKFLPLCCLTFTMAFTPLLMQTVRGSETDNHVVGSKIVVQDSVKNSNKVAFLKYDSTKHHFIFPEATPAILNADELKAAESLVDEGIKQQRSQDSIQFTKIKKTKGKAGSFISYLPVSYKRYYKQVICVNDVKGNKLVWLNFFCSKPSAYWKKDILVVLDGGPCYFNVIVNLTTHQCYQVYVNAVS